MSISKIKQSYFFIFALLLQFSLFGNAQADSSINQSLPNDLLKHVSATYIRVILPNAVEKTITQNYVNKLQGKIAFDFDFASINSRVVGITSPQGNFSLQFTDHPESYDQFRRDTRIMYVVDDVKVFLKAAEQAGFKIVQPFGLTPIATQGRFQVAPGFVVEVISFLPGKEPK